MQGLMLLLDLVYKIVVIAGRALGVYAVIKKILKPDSRKRQRKRNASSHVPKN